MSSPSLPDRVLVADDDPDFGQLVTDFLGRLGCRVEYISTGPDALSAFESSRPPLVVMDGTLPGVDGLSLAGAIKTIDERTYVLLVSAADRRDDIHALAPELRPDAFLLKPFPLSALLETLTWRPHQFEPDLSRAEGQVLWEGELDDCPLWAILGRICREHLSGVLIIHREGTPLRIHTNHGAPIFAEGGNVATTLGRLLIRDGLLTEEQYQDALRLLSQRLAAGTSTKLGELLIREKLLPPREVAAALDRQVREKVLEAFPLRSGRFELVGPSPGPAMVTAFEHPSEGLLLAGLGAHATDDDLEEIVKPLSTKRLRLVDDATDRLPRFAVSTRLHRVLRLLDGTRTVAELMKATPASARETAELLAALHLAGALTEAEPECAPREPTLQEPSPVRWSQNPEGRLAQEIVTEYLSVGSRSPYEILGIGVDASREEVERATVAKLRRLDPSQLPPSLTGDIRNMAAVLHDATRRAHRQLTADQITTPTPPPTRSQPSPPPASRPARVDAELEYRRGEQHLEAREFDEAQAAFRASVEHAPEVADYRMALGWVTFRRSPGSESAREEARRHLEEAIARDPEQSLAYYYLSRIAKLEGNQAQAHQLREQALTIARRHGAPEEREPAQGEDAPRRGWTERLKFWR